MQKRRKVECIQLISFLICDILFRNFNNSRPFDVMTCNSYLLVKLETENSCEVDTSISYLTSNIGLSLQNLFGEVGK